MQSINNRILHNSGNVHLYAAPSSEDEIQSMLTEQMLPDIKLLQQSDDRIGKAKYCLGRKYFHV